MGSRRGLDGGSEVRLGAALAPGESGLAKKSFALIDHLRSVDKRRVRRVFGETAREEMAAIDEGLAVFLGLGDRLHGAGASPVQ